MILHVFCSSWVKPRRRLDYYDNDEEEDDDLSEWVSILITRDIIVSFAAVIRVVTDLTQCFSPVVGRFVVQQPQWILCLILYQVGIIFQLWP